MPAVRNIPTAMHKRLCALETEAGKMPLDALRVREERAAHKYSHAQVKYDQGKLDKAIMDWVEMGYFALRRVLIARENALSS